MPVFLSKVLDQLTRQLTFTPPPRRRPQMDRAEQLYWQIDPDGAYPLDFIVFRITGYRTDGQADTMLVGAAVRRDLLTMVDQLSASLDERMSDYDPRPLDQDAMCKRLNVTVKTLSRYRRQGLFVRRLIWPDGKRRLAFLPDSVERFLQSRGERVHRAAKFNRLDARTRHQIVTRARRIAGRVEVSPFRVAEHLGKRFGRSTETIRLLLIKHDKHDPRVAIFPDHTPPLSEKQQRVIHRAYHRGVSVARLARRFGKSRTAIYRAINLRRAAAILQLDIRVVANPTFQRADAEEVILHSEFPDMDTAPAGDAASSDAKTAANVTAVDQPLLPEMFTAEPLTASQEQTLFVRYNYLKYRADQLRQTLDKYAPHSDALDRIETFLRRAVTIKHRLVRSNMRLVVSVARKHLAGSRRGGVNISDLVSDGSVTLLEAIETFDPARGNRFSTYLTWALMRRFAQATRPAAVSAAGQVAGPATTAAPAEYWPAAMNPALAAVEHTEQVTQMLTRLMSQLDERERFILMRHFGLGNEPGERSKAQTLAEVAEQLDISAERARQIEHRAISKLRHSAAELGMTLPGDDLLTGPPG